MARRKRANGSSFKVTNPMTPHPTREEKKLKPERSVKLLLSARAMAILLMEDHDNRKSKKSRLYLLRERVFELIDALNEELVLHKTDIKVSPEWVEI